MDVPTRDESRARLANEEFDVLVIGGGITGCGIARDAALRGLSVALVEKDDFASGTSSRSSRLIHGGVRYLEHGQLHLVLEASAERRRLLRLAPHLVRPLQFVWPVYEGARIPRWKLSAGLTLYDALALFRNVHRHHRLTKSDIHAAEPAVRTDALVGGASYFDAATDDARLTLANAIGAVHAGAVVVNHAAVLALDLRAGQARGALVADRIGGGEITLRSRVVVNATGPWSDEIRHFEAAAAPPTVRGSKGVHIAVPGDRVGNRAALTLLSPSDGRVMFALPDGRLTIFGTTDSYTAESADDVRASRADVRYLLDAANTFFPRARLDPSDVVAAWAGIRPLVSGQATSSIGASREHAVHTTAAGVVTITGGKLTTFRIMASDVVDVALQSLGRHPRRCRTARVPLPGGDISSIENAEHEAAMATGDQAIGRRLVAAHGSRWARVWDSMQHGRDGAVRIDPAFPYTLGEARFAVASEMACTLGDILCRRTRLAFETRDHGRGAAPVVARAIASALGWDANRVRAELTAYDREVERIFSIDERA